MAVEMQKEYVVAQRQILRQLVYRKAQVIERFADGSKRWRYWTEDGRRVLLTTNNLEIVSAAIEAPERPRLMNSIYGELSMWDRKPRPPHHGMQPWWHKVSVALTEGGIEDGEGDVFAVRRDRRTNAVVRTERHRVTWTAEWVGDEHEMSFYVSNPVIDGGLTDPPLEVAVNGLLRHLANKVNGYD